METLALIGFLLIVVAAVPATLFPIVYGIAARRVWWRVPAGRALMASSTALALLLDLSLLFRVVEIGDHAALLLSVVVIGLIAAGAWLKFGALIHDLRHDRGMARKP